MSKRPPAPAAADPLEAPAMPWFDAAKHVVTASGIRNAATGDLLAEDGLPVNTHARAAALAAATTPIATEE